MKKPARPDKSSSGKGKAAGDSAASGKKNSRLKPLKSKEIKRSRNPHDFDEEDDDAFPDEDGLSPFDGFGDLHADDEDDF